MTTKLSRPAVLLAVLAAVSGMLGAYFLGDGFGTAPNLGIYMPLTGLWFGIVVGFAVWYWEAASPLAAAMAILGTWAGWEAAINLALQLDSRWSDTSVFPGAYKAYVIGIVAGGIGALFTWAGAAFRATALRQRAAAVNIVSAGALLGLFLPSTNHFDNGAVLLLPWQVGVAAMIGFHLRPLRRSDESGALAVGR